MTGAINLQFTMMDNKLKRRIEDAPISPGVYSFVDSLGKVIYIGKAKNLRNRLRSYTAKNVSIKTANMLTKARNISWEITNSELEALILESEKIRKTMPLYNVSLRDDKQYTYVSVTQDSFPRIVLSRGRPENSDTVSLGPFTSNLMLERALKELRKTIAFCDCKKNHKKTCSNSQMGLCPGYCCSSQVANSISKSHLEKARKEYLKNIDNIMLVLSNRKDKALNGLEREIARHVKNEDFGRAQKAKNKILDIKKVLSHGNSIFKSTYTSRTSFRIKSVKKFSELINNNRPPKRIEAYDISNISGKHATGSMIVFELYHSNKSGLSYRPAKKDYRIFHVKGTQEPNDTKMLKEIFDRRITHLAEKNDNLKKDHYWQSPELVLIDGGLNQLNVAIKSFSQVADRTNLFGCFSLAKRQERLYTFYWKDSRLSRGNSQDLGKEKINETFLGTLPSDIQILFQEMRNEAHRFAITKHRKLASRIKK